MTNSLRPLTLPFLALILTALIGVVIAGAPPAGAQSALPKPAAPTATATGNPGEIRVSWQSVSGARFYTVGWINRDDYNRAQAAGDWQSAFHYATVLASNTDYTVSGLTAGAQYWTIVGARTARFDGDPATWSDWSAGVTTAGQHGACPTAQPTPTRPAANTPLSNAELARRVRPALGQIIARPSDGKTYGGTGFVVSSDGLMVTNRHVVDDAATVTVNMLTSAGPTVSLTGQVLGRGILADLAVIRLPAGRTYAALPLGDSDAVAQGDEITAWGYPGGSFLGDDPTLTRGIISSANRIFDDTKYLQTDASIAGGSSGRPVVDRFGRVVGVNTAGLVRVNDDGTTTPIPGIYLAIASNEVSRRLNTLAAGGPAQATYRNLRYDYGYSMTFPKGWYLYQERSNYSWFVPYGTFNRDIIISRFEFRAPYSDRSSELSLLANWYWNTGLPELAAENWSSFQPIALTKVNLSGQEYYRLEYRRRTEAEFCVENVVSMFSISSSFPSKPYGFAIHSGICEGVLATYSGEREAFFNGFRP